MAEFVLWAPLKKRVRVLVDNREHDMVEESGGWWHVDVPGAGPGTAYSFLLDDDETPLPDPRSRWQPSGVHSASRLYDHDAFFWTDRAWTGRQLAGAVVYERHFHEGPHLSQPWETRCKQQLVGTLGWLESQLKGEWLAGPKMTHADIATACMVGYLMLRLPEALREGEYPELERHSLACEKLEAFVACRPSPDEVMPA